MKSIARVILSLVLYLSAVSCYSAAPLVNIAPINGVGTPVTVAISSTTLTKVPTSQTSGRMGIYINVPSTWSVVGFMGDCTSTSLASTIRPLEWSKTTINVGPSIDPSFMPIREDVCLWLISLNTTASSQNIHYQEVKK